MSQSTVVIFGATSYLGGYLIDDLLARGYSVVAVTRNPAVSDILLHRWVDQITVTTAEELHAVGGASAVVNLAYIKGEMPHRLLRQNERLARRVHDATMQLRAARLVHVSSQAVFGYKFEGPPRAVRATRHDGDPYIEGKIHAEHLLEAWQPSADYRLDIVRPGNIIGEGSPAWTTNLAQRILEGRPVGVVDRDGYSNAAYAPNLASYIGFVVQSALPANRDMGRYHHFADLSALRWAAITARFGQSLGVAPVLSKSIWEPRGISLRPKITSERLKTVNLGPIGAAARRSLAKVDDVQSVVDAGIFRLKTALAGARDADVSGLDDSVVLNVMSSEHEFRSELISGWAPPWDCEAAVDRMSDWLSRFWLSRFLGPDASGAGRGPKT